MIDPNQKIQMRLVRPEGDVNIVLRFPTDEEWKARQDKRKHVVTDLGRGKTKEEDQGQEADAEMIQLCLEIEGSEPVVVSQAEAARIISELSEVALVSFERVGAGFDVELEDFADRLHSFRLAMPTADRVAAYRRDLVKVKPLGANKRSLSIDMAAVQKLWDELTNGNAPYPLPWKSAVLKRVMESLDDLVVVRENPPQGSGLNTPPSIGS
jgi:hypothetical protein